MPEREEGECGGDGVEGGGVRAEAETAVCVHMEPWCSL